MEEKNEDYEKNDNDTATDTGAVSKVGFFTKLGNFIKLVINFVVLGVIAVVVGAYYIKDVRDLVQSVFPDIKLPYHETEVKDNALNPDIENLTPISNLVRKEEKTADKPLLSPSVSSEEKALAEAENREVKTETPVAEKTETPVKTDAEKTNAEKTDAENKDEKAPSDVKTVVSEDTVITGGTEVIKTDAAVSENEVAKVIQKTEEDKVLTDPAITKEVMDKVMANIENSGKFTASSFDPVIKADEKLPADKYASASMEEKFLDLMNRNSDLVSIVKQMNERVARLEASRIDPVIVSALIEKTDALKKRIDALPTSGTASAMVIAASHLRYAVLSGEGFTYELDTLKLLAAKNDALTTELANLDGFAASGVKTVEELKSEFSAAITEADGHALADRTDDLKGKLLNKVSELVVIKRLDGRPVNEDLFKLNDKVLPLLASGNIDEVLALIDKENVATQGYFKTFVADAADKSKVMKVLNKISSSVSDNFKTENNSVPAGK